jgi:hypothetical protein
VLPFNLCLRWQRILDSSPGLYPHEHDVAAKVLEDVRNMGHAFGRGRYFEPMVHQVKEAPVVSGQKTEVKATFISIPIFCAMRSQESETKQTEYGRFRKPLQRIFENIHRLVHEEKYTSHRQHHLASRKLRLRNDHPIRSLMQYANILALDNSRDRQQAIVRLEDYDGSQQAFIHVPEFWALIINNCKSCLAPPARLLTGQIQSSRVLLSPLVSFWETTSDSELLPHKIGARW